MQKKSYKKKSYVDECKFRDNLSQWQPHIGERRNKGGLTNSEWRTEPYADSAYGFLLMIFFSSLDLDDFQVWCLQDQTFYVFTYKQKSPPYLGQN